MAMQVTELAAEGLKRAFTVVVPAADIAAARDQRLVSLAKEIRMPGFRPGKVPANLVRKMHGPALQQEALNKAVQDGVQKTIADAKLLMTDALIAATAPLSTEGAEDIIEVEG